MYYQKFKFSFIIMLKSVKKKYSRNDIFHMMLRGVQKFMTVSLYLGTGKCSRSKIKFLSNKIESLNLTANATLENFSLFSLNSINKRNIKVCNLFEHLVIPKSTENYRWYSHEILIMDDFHIMK